MIEIMRALWWILGSQLKSRERLEAENLALRHQVAVLRRPGMGMFERLRQTQEGKILGPELMLALKRWGEQLAQQDFEAAQIELGEEKLKELEALGYLGD